MNKYSDQQLQAMAIKALEAKDSNPDLYKKFIFQLAHRSQITPQEAERKTKRLALTGTY